MTAAGNAIPWPVGLVGAGYVGRALAERLGEHADAPAEAILATTRSGTWDGGEPPDFVRLRGWDNGSDAPRALRTALTGARSLVVAWSSGGGGQDRREVFVEGARKLRPSIEDLGLQRLVYISSTSALPDVDAWLDETCQARPLSQRGQVQRDAEDAIIETAEKLSLPWVVLRSAGIYGPGRELARLYRRDPNAVAPGDGMRPTNLIQRDDLVSAIVAALLLDADRSAIVHVCDDDHCTRREMVQRVAELDAGPPPRWERVAERGAPAVGKRVSNRRLKTLLGVRLEHPTHLPEAP